MEAISLGQQCITLNQDVFEGSIYDFMTTSFISTDNIDLYTIYGLQDLITMLRFLQIQ